MGYSRYRNEPGKRDSALIQNIDADLGAVLQKEVTP
jgi:hypothetical protein